MLSNLSITLIVLAAISLTSFLHSHQHCFPLLMCVAQTFGGVQPPNSVHTACSAVRTDIDLEAFLNRLRFFVLSLFLPLDYRIVLPGLFFESHFVFIILHLDIIVLHSIVGATRGGLVRSWIISFFALVYGSIREGFLPHPNLLRKAIIVRSFVRSVLQHISVSAQAGNWRK
jgi:hypothetical protein